MGGTSSSSLMDNPIDQNNELPTGAVPEQTAQPNKANRRARQGVGGTYSHGPLCTCNPCKARRRQPETLLISTGNGGARLAPLPDSVAPTKKKPAARKPLRDRIAQFLHYSAMMPNASRAEIAEKMGLDRRNLTRIIREGQETGILVFDDPLDRIEYEIIPKVVDNLNYFLDAKDKTVTIEAAKGTIFRQFQDAKGISENQQTILALKIEQPDGAEVKVMTGHIVGRPKTIEDHFVSEHESE